MAWNKPSEVGRVAPRPPEKVRRFNFGGRGATRPTIFVIVLGAAVAAWWLWPSGETRQDAASTKKTLIKEVTPAAAPTNKVVQTEKVREIPYWEKDDTNGLTRAQLQKWKIFRRPPAKYTNDTSRTEAPPAYAIFSHRSENSLAAIMTLKPGATLVGDPLYERWFTRDFLNSLKEPIIVTKDDTPEQAQLKRDMNAMKIDLKARYDAGEDIAKIVSDTHKELQMLSAYKQELERDMNEMIRKPDITENDINDFLEAANKMLDSKGIAPMKLGPVARRRLMRLKKANEGTNR